MSAEKETSGAVDSTRYCAPDEIWVCGACGKTSEFDCYGIKGKRSWGWDESCMLNAVKVKRQTLRHQESANPSPPPGEQFSWARKRTFPYPETGDELK